MPPSDNIFYLCASQKTGLNLVRHQTVHRNVSFMRFFRNIPLQITGLKALVYKANLECRPYREDSVQNVVLLDNRIQFVTLSEDRVRLVRLTENKV